jgi:hypothetical protein
MPSPPSDRNVFDGAHREAQRASQVPFGSVDLSRPVDSDNLKPSKLLNPKKL